jgi:hypothetical protein
MILSALKSLSAKFGRPGRLRGSTPERHAPERHANQSEAERTSASTLCPPLTREDIRQGYRMILGREPESEQAIDEQLQHASVAAFRLSALKSIEFRGQYRAIWAEKPDPYWSSERPAVVFVHLQKTGGTTLRDLLAAQFEEDRVCPGPNLPIYSFSVAELGHYDFFAGHYELDSIRFIPRRNVRTLSLFREPCARLISWYRFHKSHPPYGAHAVNRFVQLANDLTAEEFFEAPEVRANQLVYNHYLLSFGRSFAWFDHRRDSLSRADLDSALQDAKRQIRTLTALGITERFAQSVRHICKTLDLPPPATVKAANVTDDMQNLYSGFRRVDPVSMTPRLAAALEELTAYDQELYRFAIREFERRCAEPEALAHGASAALAQSAPS